MAKYHVDTESKGRLVFDKLPNHTYFLSGYDGPQEAGKATFYTFDNCGTCLIPIIETATGKQVQIVKNAGKSIRNGKLVNA